jgi:hypothetical protein
MKGLLDQAAFEMGFRDGWDICKKVAAWWEPPNKSSEASKNRASRTM